MRPVCACIAALVVVAALPAGAAGSVAIGPQQVVVQGDGGSATIDRSPFRISFADRAGRTVLAQVANTAQAPQVVPPTPQPIPLGNDTETRPALYAPLQFTVGQARDVEYPGSQWNGDSLTGTEAGVIYSARDVTDVRPAGAGVQLTVSTSDPSGRKLAVTVAPGPAGTIEVRAVPTPSDGVASLGDSFDAGSDEAFRGFGGRHNALDQRGQDFYNWIEQENVGAGSLQPGIDPAPGTGGQGYQFPNGKTAGYWVQSQFVSSRPYGFLLDRDEISRWRMASDRPDAWQVGVGAPAIDYLVAPGSAPVAIRNLTAVGGRHRAPPEWALGGQMDRLVRFPNDDAAAYMANFESDLKHIEAGDIRLTAYRIEGWWFFDDATVRRMIARLHAIGIRALLYYRPFFDHSTGVNDPAGYDALTQNGWAATTPAGQPYVFVDNFNQPAVLLDVTDPGARAWWESRIRHGLDLGADGFMQDFGEQVQVDMRFADGSTGAEMHNRYPKLYHALTRAVLDRYAHEHPGRQFFWYTRAGYSGTPGAPASETSNFPGDETTDWSRSSGLASLTTDMLNRAIGGAYGFNADIGGYFDVGPYQPTTKELFLRWAEWSALSPVFRLHGSAGAGTHAPWSFDRDTVRVYRAITALRLHAARYILSQWRAAARTGVPLTRPLWLAYPGDPEAAKQDQEWLLGPDVLVAPVVVEGVTARDVYFPRGCWEAGDTGERHQGPAHARVAAPLARLPYFFRCGSQPFGASQRACVDRRKFSFRVHQPRRGSIVRLDVFVNGRRTALLRGRRITRVTLTRLPQGRFTVRIVAHWARGPRTVSVRRYVGCRKGRPRTRVHR
ncbi:MAG: sulfoquinovosidase [Thermoleophilaceae bacterium]|nr:sulfoquinovosidase [Thermoleophilaceae bacterium]